MKRIDFRRVFVITGLTVLVIVYAVLWLRMISSRAERTGADFIVFYTAGHIAQTNGVENVYEPGLQQAVEQTLVGFQLVPGQVLLYNHVPYLIPILTMLISENYVTAFYRWAILLLIIFIAGTVLLARSLYRAGWAKADVWLAEAGILTFFPIFVSLLNGQDTAFLFFGSCLLLVGLCTGKDWLAGLGLALTTIRPQITVLLAIPFLFRRQKVIGWFGLGAGILGGLSLAILGVEGMRGFLNLLLVSASGVWYGLKEPAMVNLIGLLWRFVPGLGGDAIHWIGWVTYGMALIGLCVLWAHSREISEKQLGVVIIVSLFAVPHLHYHDLALLIVALLPGLVIFVRRGLLSARNASLAPLTISFFLLISSLVPQLKFNVPYLVMVLLFLMLCFPVKIFFWRRQAPEIIP